MRWHYASPTEQKTEIVMIKAMFKILMRDRRGASAIEMGLICSLIILAIMTALETFAGESQITWNSIASKTSAAISSSN